MLKGARGRRGFTLIETVVTVGIVATLAAVVVPQVVKQMDAADPTKTAEDLKTISTAIETFGVNVRPHQPYDIEDLTNAIQDGTTAFDSTALGARYSASDASSWNGPYLSLSLANNVGPTATVISTGYAATIRNRLPSFDVGIADPVGGDTVDATSANGDFVAVMIGGLSGAAFNAINELIDGPTEANAVNRRSLGRFRCPYTVASAGTLTDATACTAAYYLASPTRR